MRWYGVSLLLRDVWRSYDGLFWGLFFLRQRFWGGVRQSVGGEGGLGRGGENCGVVAVVYCGFIGRSAPPRIFRCASGVVESQSWTGKIMMGGAVGGGVSRKSARLFLGDGWSVGFLR